MNISLRHSEDQPNFEIERDIDANGEDRIFVHGGLKFAFSMNIKEADELYEKLKQCLMDVELSKLFNKPIKLGN